MRVDDLLTWLTQGCLVVIAVLTLIDLLRYRDQARLDIALMFGALAAIVLLQSVPRSTDAQLRLLRSIVALLLLAQPYLLLRLVLHFQPVPQRIRLSALGGMVGSWLILLTIPSPLPLPLTLLVVAYFVFVEGYAAVAFIRGARRTAGATHWRLFLAASGSGLLAMVILLAGVNAVVPAGTGITTPFSQVLALLSMLCYYFGFVPPWWLRQTWHLSELQRFLREIAGRSAAERANVSLDHLCGAATRAVGGLAALVVLTDDTEQQFTIQAASGPFAVCQSFTITDGPLARAWHARQPTLAKAPADFGDTGRQLAASLAADALLAVPLITTERAWGILMVFLRRCPLFAADDLNLLALFTEQSAFALAYAALFNEQQTLLKQLQQRTRHLESTNKELEAFSYSVSHDLRAPLRSIDGFSQALLEDYGDRLDKVGQDYLQRVRAATQRMAQLIDDLLSLARVTRSELRYEAVDLSVRALAIMADLRRMHPERQVSCIIAPDVTAHGDARLLQLVLENLLGNAWKFTAKRADAIIEFGALSCEGQAIYFVRDNGAGFDMAYADKLFGAFQRLHPVTEFAGTGVGLATVQRIIHRHGGQVWAESAVDQGAAFYFTVV